MGKRVLVAARDLFFRSKLTAVVQAAGAELTRDDAACDLAVVELGPADVVDRIRALAGRGIPVVAFGSHVKPNDLRAAREVGAVAVANSAVEARLRELLGGADPRPPARGQPT
ncbi:MAG: hypothetical protein ACREMM_02325 [Gemmatimonadales bacterium]